MKNTYYYTTFMLLASSAMAGMELTIPIKENKAAIHAYDKILTPKAKSTRPKPSFIFITNENQPQNITIPRELAMHCNTIKNMLDDVGSNEMPQFTINTDTENALLFISYLKKIDSIHNAQSEKLELYNNMLSQYINTLDTTELINLTHNVDCLDVIDKNKNNALITILANRISKTPREQINCFESLNNKALFRSVMQKIGKDENLDKKLLQPYSDALTEQQSLPRTEWRLMSLCTKIYNGFSWDTILRYKPYYINTQTGTIIKSEEIVDESCNTKTTKQLNIFKKNSSPITIKLNNVDKIIHISANADESLFVCKLATRHDEPHEPIFYRESDTCLLINLNNTDGQIQRYNACAFTQNNDEAYIAYEKNKFGILNTTTGNITQIGLNNNNKKIYNIVTNNNGSIVAIYTHNKVFIGRKREKNPLVFVQQEMGFPSNVTITNICLHPTENSLYIQTATHFYVIDLTSFNDIIDKALPYLHAPSHVGFPSKDILFLGYGTEDDCFFNITTGNCWTKKKQWNSISRLALTTDLMNSIEEIKSDYGEKHNRRITVKSAPIIDPTIVKTVECLNEGYLPLSLLTIANTTADIATLSANDLALFDNQGKHLKTVITTVKTVTDDSTASTFTGAFNHIYKKMQRMSSTAWYYGKTGAIYTVYAIAYVALAFLNSKNNSSMPKDSLKGIQDIHSLIEQLLWLVE
jgi:hypothetical protein